MGIALWSEGLKGGWRKALPAVPLPLVNENCPNSLGAVGVCVQEAALPAVLWGGLWVPHSSGCSCFQSEDG